MVSFPIFERDNKTFHLNIENVLFVLLVFFGILGSSLQHTRFAYVINYAIGIIIICGFILLFANIFRIKPLYGKLNDSIIFDSSYIQIKDKVYSIEMIDKIFLRMNDYEGLEYIKIKPSFFPRLSNGTNNVVRLELKNGEKTITFFQSNLEYDYEKLRPLVVSLIRYNLLSIDGGRKILKLNTDYEVLKLQNEVNKKELK